MNFKVRKIVIRTPSGIEPVKVHSRSTRLIFDDHNIMIKRLSYEQTSCQKAV